ncbi:short-chain collagen C4-like [Oculina patagonica]
MVGISTPTPERGLPGSPGLKGPQGPKGAQGDPGRNGTQGPQGPQGPKGTQGDPGTNGTKGPQGPQGAAGRTGDKGNQGLKGDQGAVGRTGDKGSQGVKGEKGRDGTVKSGVQYIRWGRTTCPSGAQEVYKGVVGSDQFDNYGGGGEYLCLTKNPAYTKYKDGPQSHSYIYGTEYAISFNPFSPTDVHNYEVPCVSCYVASRTAYMMIPGFNGCPSGWHEEYGGYLMSGQSPHKKSRNFICTDVAAEGVPGTQADRDGALLYLVEGVCGSLPCPPYVNGRELSCAVCTK